MKNLLIPSWRLMIPFALWTWVSLGQVTAVRTQNSPSMDGRLDDRCWQNVVEYEKFYKNSDTNEISKNRTSVKFIYDEKAIYVGVKCFDSNPASIKSRKVDRDGNIYNQDCVEVMIDPFNSQDCYFHFLVSALGDVSDEFCTQGGNVRDLKWNGQWEARTYVGEDFWSCEVKIPFFNFSKIDKMEKTWGVNVCRGKRDPREDSSILKEGAYHKAGSFLVLQGIDVDFSKYQLSLMQPSVALKIEENQKLSVTIQSEVLSGLKKDEKITVEGWLVSPKGNVKTSATESCFLTAQGSARVSLPQIPGVTEQGEYLCVVRTLDENQKTTAYQEAQVSIRYTPIQIALIEPWYRHSIFETQKLQKVIFDVNLNVDQSQLGKKPLEVLIKGQEGNRVVWTKTLDKPLRTNRFEISNHELPMGRFLIEANLRAKENDGEFSKAEFPLWKLPYKQGEVWMDREGNWKRDGEFFFVNTGWMNDRLLLDEHTVYLSNTVKPHSKCWISTRVMHDLCHDEAAVKVLQQKNLDEATRIKIRKMMQTDKEEPLLFAHFLMDEPPGRSISPLSLQQAFELMKEEDPYHPVIVSDDKMPNTVMHLKCCDIQAYHPYPPMFKDKKFNDSTSIAKDADEVKKYLRNKYHQVSLMFMHMGFNYEDFTPTKKCRIGTYREFRDQAVMAVVSGAKGFIQYNRNVEDYPELKIGLKYLVKEQKWMGSVLLSGYSKIELESPNKEIRMLAKDMGDKQVFMMSAVSTQFQKVQLKLKGLSSKIKCLYVVSEDRTVEVVDGCFKDEFEACASHIYSTVPVSSLENIKSIESQIEAEYKLRVKKGNLVCQRNVNDAVEIEASSFSNIDGRSETVLWHLTDGYVPSINNEYGFMHWTDATPGQFPDWVTIKMKKKQSIGRIEIFPMEKSLKDYEIQVWNGEGWQSVVQAKDQSGDHLVHCFDVLETDRVRVWITATHGVHSKIGEIEIYEK